MRKLRNLIAAAAAVGVLAGCMSVSHNADDTIRKCRHTHTKEYCKKKKDRLQKVIKNTRPSPSPAAPVGKSKGKKR